MSWLFSRALVEEYSGENFSGGEPSAQLNVMPTQHKFWRSDKMIDHSNLSRFGLTLRLLTETSGEELLTSYLAAFPAKTLAQQEKGLASPANDQGYGSTWRASFAKYDQNTRSLKIAQCSLFEDSNESCVTWPRWGSMRNGVCWEQTTVELHILEKESGCLLPTPTTIDTGSRVNKSASVNAKTRPTLGAMAKHNLWPTPKANDAEKRGNFDVHNPRNGLPAAAKMWATPTARDWKTGDKPESRRARQKQKGRWHSPNLNDTASPGGQLNPTWVEWLMGWPLEWTELKPLGMGKFQEWRQQHSSCYEPELKLANY